MDQLKLFLILGLSCLFVAGQGVPDSGECPNCAVVLCRIIEVEECEAGTVLDRCGCCLECGKLNGEKCGGPDEKYGKCGDQLICVPQNGGGLCAPCPPVTCSNICPYDLFAKDENGCNTCTCLCPPSNCLTIRCGYGFIESIDANGCKSCSCKEPAYCPFNGKKYRLGAVRYKQCNQCRCQKRGWACQSRKCRGGVCYYQRYKVKNKKSFFDGCNTCTCSAKNKKKIGTLTCTEKACPNCRSNLYCKKLRCRHGRVVNIHGCEVCRCKKVKLCKSNCKKITKLCPDRVEKYTDFRGCTQCRCKADHAGFCPLFPQPAPLSNCGLRGGIPCLPDICSKDTDCAVDKKCCVSGGVQGSPRDCITPWPTPFP